MQMCATVYLKANGMRQRDDVMSSGSYISANDQRLHFGLGDATDPGTAEIHWPSGCKGNGEAAFRGSHLPPITGRHRNYTHAVRW